MGFQWGVQFLGHSRACQDSSLLDSKVLSGRNILWTGSSIYSGFLELWTWDSCLIFPDMGKGSELILSFPYLPAMSDGPGLSTLFKLSDKHTRPLLSLSLIPWDDHISLTPDSSQIWLQRPSLIISSSLPPAGAFTVTLCPYLSRAFCTLDYNTDPFLPTFLTLSGLGGMQQSGGASRQEETGPTEVQLTYKKYNEWHICKLHNLVSFGICIPMKPSPQSVSTTTTPKRFLIALCIVHPLVPPAPYIPIPHPQTTRDLLSVTMLVYIFSNNVSIQYEIFLSGFFIITLRLSPIIYSNTSFLFFFF